MVRLLDRVIVFGILTEIVFSALAYGTTESWAVALFKAGAATLMLLWCIRCFVQKRVKVILPATALPVLAFLILGLAQSFALTGGSGLRHSLSLDVEATRSALAMLVSLIILFLLSVNSLGKPGRLRLLAHFLAFYGIAVAIFALIQHFTCDGCLYWTKATGGRPFGPFPNRNHFAGYMELLMPVPLAILAGRAADKWALIYAIAALLTGMAVVMSLSRGGMLSLGAEIVFIVAMSKRLPPYQRKQRRRQRQPMAQRWIRLGAPIALVLSIAMGVIWIGPGRIVERLSRMMGDFVSTEGGRPDSRQGIWKDTALLIRANPVVGIGLGAFATAFPLYESSNGSIAIVAAHNDYLQILADTGILGGLIGLWFVIVVVRATARATLCRDPFLSSMALGCGAGILGILVHSLFDFNLQIPSTALLFLVFVAVISHVSSVVSQERSSQTLAKQAP